MKNLLIITQKVDKNDQLLGFFLDWLRRFSMQFEKVTVLCLEKGRFELPENVKVISLGKDYGAGKLKQLSNFYKNIFGLRGDYDAVFVHMNPIWVVLGGVSWRLMGKKIFFWYTHKAVTPKLRMAEKFADVIFTASRESFRLPSKKVIVTGHGIDTELFKPNPANKLISNKLRILSVGRIAPVKNYGTLVEAAKILKDKNLDFYVTMVGEAPLPRDREYEGKIKSQITNYKLESNFSFVGKIEHKNLPAIYQSHDIFIHLSKTGSLDKTILEAMASGMNVLSSNDAAKAFLSEKNLFDGGDSTMLAEKILSTKSDPVSPDLRNYVVENHALDNLIQKICSIIYER